MKRLLLAILASVLLLGTTSCTVFATNPYEVGNEDVCTITGYNDPLICGHQNSNEEAEMQGHVGSVLNTVYMWIGIIAVIVIIIGGYQYMTSQGDPGRIQRAKSTILYSVIGLVVTLGAFAITTLILSALGGNSTNGGGGGGGGGGSQVTAIQIISGNSVLEGKTLQLQVKIVPDYATDRTLTFSSSDTSVATISDTGLITALKAGTTTITATASNGVNTTMTLTVEKIIAVESVKINPATATIKIGASTTFSATVSPSDAANKSLTWTSSNTSVATVTSSGVVKGIKEGTATITATAANGIKGTATVTVESNEVKYPAVFEKRNYKHTNGHDLDYILSVPEGAHSGMPLVVYLHGDGEVNNPTRLKGLKPVQYLHATTSVITLAPVTKTTDWSSEYIQLALKGLIDKYISEYKIDTKRVYIMGFSRGAIGTWTFVNRYPNLFAAAVPVSCCGSISGSNYKTTKVYALAGSQESNYIGCMKSNVNAINSAGGSAKFESVAGQTHNTITANFPYGQVIDGWMLKQSR